MGIELVMRVKSWGKMIYITALLAAMLVCLILLIVSMEGVFGQPTHDRFWNSRKYYFDPLTEECFMVLVDKFGRGVAIVPCHKIPPEKLHALPPKPEFDQYLKRAEPMKQ